PDLDLQHVGKPYPREDVVPRKRGLEQQVDDVLRLRQEARTKQVETGELGARKQAGGLALGPLRDRVRRVAAGAPSGALAEQAIKYAHGDRAECKGNQNSGGHADGSLSKGRSVRRIGGFSVRTLSAMRAPRRAMP